MRHDPSRRPQIDPHLLPEAEVRGAVALQVPELSAPEPDRELAAAVRAHPHARPRRDLPHDPLARRLRADWARLSGTWTSRIDERIAELQRLRAGLTECIGCGCLSLERCALANPGDRAARLGSRPRYWVGDRPAG